VLYLDSSALVKLIVAEAGSAALARFLGRRGDEPVAASAIIRVEVPRSVRGHGAKAYRDAFRLVDDVDQIPVSLDLLDEAAGLTSGLRSLDAVHLTSAIRLVPDLTTFVAYDRRLLVAASEHGLVTASPGVSFRD
jgi:predicted nucleic acid-binding protein